MAKADRVWIDTPTQNSWLLGEPVPGAVFRMGQQVEVVGGPARGVRGVLISLYALAPEPEYHLETDDGGDVIVVQSQIRAGEAEPALHQNGGHDSFP